MARRYSTLDELQMLDSESEDEFDGYIDENYESSENEVETDVNTIVYRYSARGRSTIQQPKLKGGRWLGKNLRSFAHGTLIYTQHPNLHTAS